MVSIEIEGERVVACQTAAKQRITAPWFIDGSGQAQVFGKAFRIPKVEYGRHKVCLWTYFNTPIRNEGTTFYGDTTDKYLTWIWEIPITPSQISVGCIMPAAQCKEHRRNGKQVEDILRDELTKYPPLAQLLTEQPNFQVRRCSYRSYVYQNVSGPNWLMIGESASLPDPLTANGVTAAFRHAQAAANFIKDSLHRGSFSKRQRHVYNTNVRRMGHAFNHSIETSVYEWPVRWGLGVLGSERIYTTFAYPINALYSKFQPQGPLAMPIFGLLFAVVWLWMESWALAGRLAFLYHRFRQWQQHLGIAQVRKP